MFTTRSVLTVRWFPYTVAVTSSNFLTSTTSTTTVFFTEEGGKNQNTFTTIITTEAWTRWCLRSIIELSFLYNLAYFNWWTKWGDYLPIKSFLHCELSVHFLSTSWAFGTYVPVYLPQYPNNQCMVWTIFCVCVYAVPTTSPQNVAIEWISPSEIYVSWDPLSLEEARGFVSSYTITYSAVS